MKNSKEKIMELELRHLIAIEALNEAEKDYSDEYASLKSVRPGLWFVGLCISTALGTAYIENSTVFFLHIWAFFLYFWMKAHHHVNFLKDLAISLKFKKDQAEHRYRKALEENEDWDSIDFLDSFS